jgi:hypothetical protein
MNGLILAGLCFTSIVIFFSYTKPDICRIILGLFFLFIGGVVSTPLIIMKPFYAYQMGMTAIFPYYRIFTEKIIGLNPILFGVFLILLELGVGIMLLSKQETVKGGLALGALLLAFLLPVGGALSTWTLSFPFLFYLMKGHYESSILDRLNKSS